VRLYYHMSIPYLSNTYLVSSDDRGAAVLIDPGTMDVPLLQIVEGNGYYIRSILITRSYESHVKGIRTILRIYDADIYSANQTIDDIPCRVIGHGDAFNLHGLPVEVFGAHAFCRDAVFFKIRNALFTGDVLTAGFLGEVPSAFSKALLTAKIKERFSTLDESIAIFPGYGPPTTVGLEKTFNRDLSAQT